MKKGLKGLFFAIAGVLALSLASCGSSEHKHVGTEWKRDTANHWHECSECDEMFDTSIHTYGEWVVTQEADHVNSVDGSRYRICTVCQFKFTEAIKAMPVLYLVGGINGWGDAFGNEQYKFTINGTTETLEGITLAEGDEFKIASQGWSNEIGSSNLDDSAKTYFGGDGNIKCLVAGTYTFTVNDAAGARKLTVTKTA